MKRRAAAWMSMFVLPIASSCSDHAAPGEGGAPTPAANAAFVHEAFPDAAAHIFGRSSPARTAGGHLLHAASALGLTLQVPDAPGTLRLQGGGLELRVREHGVTGPSSIVDGTIAYATRDGASFWQAAPSGVEEWLYVDRGDVGDLPVAVWSVEGARLEQRGEAIALLDGAGEPRVWVTAPIAYDRRAQVVDVQLVARGDSIELWAHAEGPLLVDPLWSTVGPMSQARSTMASVLLLDGRVLATGGTSAMVGIVDVSEVFDPAASSWTTVGAMTSPRIGHTLSLLPGGDVLAAGGLRGGTQSSAELFSTAMGSWSPAGSMAEPRSGHAASELLDGTVLVAAGFDGVATIASAELYDPVADAWTPLAPLSAARTDHTATLLLDGRVLVAGGCSMTCTVTVGAEVYDPVTDTWQPTGPMAVPRFGHVAGLLPDGRVLVAGGNAGAGPLNAAEVYDPVTNTWAATQPMATARAQHAMAPLLDGRLLVVGGLGSAVAPQSTEIYDVLTGTWTPTAFLTSGRVSLGAAGLQDGTVLAWGGTSPAGVYLASTERFDLDAFPASTCSDPADCASGFCVDGYCCDEACGDGSSGDCLRCNVPGKLGTCSVAAGMVCRPANGECDVDDVCADTAECPADGVASGIACGTLPSDPCDLVEACNGVDKTCPPNDSSNVAEQGLPCRPAMGACDATEVCNGVDGACPADESAPDGTRCGVGFCMDGLCSPTPSATSSSGGGGDGGGGGEGGSGGDTATMIDTAPATTPPQEEEEGDCSCRVPARGPVDARGLALALAALAVARHRRQRSASRTANGQGPDMEQS